MARQGKSTESPTKSGLKTAKRAAAKARQDLIEEFATKSSKDVYTPDTDAVDVSLVRIPKKLKVVPVLSLAPPSPTTQDTQDRSIAPPETVTIPSQYFSPLTIQESTCDNLSVPTIRSRLNYEAIPIKYAYLMDVEDCSSEDKLSTLVELLSENRIRSRQLARKIKEVTAKNESQKAKNPEEQYHRDALNQKTFASEFTGKDSHNMFREILEPRPSPTKVGVN